MRNTHRIWFENLKGRDHSEDKDVDGKIILKYILENTVNIAQGRDQSRPLLTR